MSSRVTEVMTTCERPSRSAASATRSGSSNSTVSVFPFGTLQNPHGRVQTLPRIMKVAVCWLQHSVRFGQRALSQTVWSPRSVRIPSVINIPGSGIGRFSHLGSRRLGRSTTGSDSGGGMDHPPGAFQQRVAGVEVPAIVAELFGEMADEVLACGVHRDGPGSLGGQ